MPSSLAVLSTKFMGEKSPAALFAELSSPLDLAAGKKRGFCPLGIL